MSDKYSTLCRIRFKTGQFWKAPDLTQTIFFLWKQSKPWSHSFIPGRCLREPACISDASDHGIRNAGSKTGSKIGERDVHGAWLQYQWYDKPTGTAQVFDNLDTCRADKKNQHKWTTVICRCFCITRHRSYFWFGPRKISFQQIIQCPQVLKEKN